MSKPYPHIIPDLNAWPINVFGASRRDYITELNEVVLSRLLDKHERDLQSLLEKSLYLERQRVKTSPWKVDPVDDKSYWSTLTTELKEASKRNDAKDLQMAILKRIINRYSNEIVGNFNPKTFRFARKFLTFTFKALYNRFISKGTLRFWGNRDTLVKRLNANGYVEETRKLFEKGTVVVVPTHFSNLDSIMIGYIMDSVAGLPAFSFGAGLNLYDTELVGYFMNRLGAYRVDRRKKNPIYLECLKAMTTHSLLRGVNNIFFPGGTRSRSGAIEERLKLGLLGSAVEAQRAALEADSGQRIYVVPLVLGYNFVLEGESLIEQHLRREGKERYSRSRNKPSMWRQLSSFSSKLMRKRGDVTMTFGEPMDVFGNLVDADGISRDRHNNVIDHRDYFTLDGNFQGNSQRESVYTRILGERILKSYMRNNTVLPSHLMAYLGWCCLRKYYLTDDVFELLKMPHEEFYIEISYFRNITEQALTILRKWEDEGKIRLDERLALDIDRVIKEGIYQLGLYHPKRPLTRDKKGDIVSQNFKLLYFYHNRSAGYFLDREIEWPSINRSSTAEPINI